MPEAIIEKIREALAFYCDRRGCTERRGCLNHLPAGPQFDMDPSKVSRDEGAQALQALEGLGKVEKLIDDLRREVRRRGGIQP